MSSFVYKQVMIMAYEIMIENLLKQKEEKEENSKMATERQSVTDWR